MHRIVTHLLPLALRQRWNTNKKKKKPRAVRKRSRNASSYSSQFLEGLRPFVRIIKDVAADGNCGFKAIAALIGHTEDGWKQVRRELLQELLAHVESYKALYGVENKVEELIKTLSYYEDHPSYNHWLTMPDMGHLIASRYNLVLFHFSRSQCLTFLPLRSPPLPASTRLEIAIGFVNENHFVQVFMIRDHPVPPIANKWREFHLLCTSGWELAYEDRIRRFKEIISPDVATCETVSLD